MLAWGINDRGNLGDGTTTEQDQPVPVTGLPLNDPVVAIAAGGQHSLALTRGGQLLAWGDNTYGELGDGTTSNQAQPVAVRGLPAGDPVVAIAAGGAHSLALTRSGRVLAWGWNRVGDLGDGSTVDRYQPVVVQGLPANNPVVAIAAGYNHSLALTRSGQVWAWGDNAAGELGDGTTMEQDQPVRVTGLPINDRVIAVGAGYNHSLALTHDGQVLAWGQTNGDRLGDATFSYADRPVTTVGLPAGDPAVAIAAGAEHILALTRSGKVLAWGWNDGQFGDRTTNQSRPAPVTGLPSGDPVVALAGGDAHSLALTRGGFVLAWGTNDVGQLGDGRHDNRGTPDYVLAGSAGNATPQPTDTPEPTATPTPVAVRLTGFTLRDDPLRTRWLPTVTQALTDSVSISVVPAGSSDAVARFGAAQADLALRVAPLTAAQLRAEAARCAPAAVLHLPLALYPVAIGYTLPGVGRALRLSPAILAALLSGHITRWNDVRLARLNPGVRLPDLPVRPVRRSDANRPSALLGLYLAAAHVPLPLAGTGVTLVRGVAAFDTALSRPGAIGVTDLPTLRQLHVAAALLPTASEAYVPPSSAMVTTDTSTLATLLSGHEPDLLGGRNAYPLSGLVAADLCRPGSDVRGRVLGALLRYGLGAGQSDLSALGYGALPPVLRQAALAALGSNSVPTLAAPSPTPASTSGTP